MFLCFFFFFFQAEDGIRDVERSRGLGDVYKRQVSTQSTWETTDKEMKEIRDSEHRDAKIHMPTPSSGMPPKEGTPLLKDRKNQLYSEKKEKLINLIFKNEITIKEASSRLGFNYSTAKNIVKLHKIKLQKGPFPQDSSNQRLNQSNEKKELGSTIPLSKILVPFYNKETAEALLLKAGLQVDERSKFLVNFAIPQNESEIKHESETKRHTRMDKQVQGNSNSTREFSSRPHCSLSPQFNFNFYSSSIHAWQIPCSYPVVSFRRFQELQMKRTAQQPL
eukprot:TRINITY_DN3082_c0_g1_i1.p1 TRINITY_DN3082_c0_g1~~TRINITY_DN3082_c0_g1_i1.p1  ORF type:complete len:278 (+),score=44.76 TRINITY_DN3082_c0_g1_i1:107-940(+)